jgi:hypothetical protein
MSMPPRRLDYAAFALAAIGVVGMIGHFWIEEYGGMAWSAGTAAVAVMYMTARIGQAAWRSGSSTAVKLHIVLACVNFWLAATMGVLVAIDKAAHVLPGFVLANVFAHAHLAALGWATMMVVGVGYRLLPMTLPSRMPNSRLQYASAALLETGVLGLFCTLLVRSWMAALFGTAIVAGLGVFAGHVAWMLRRPAPKPPAAPRIDIGVLHAGSAGLSLVVATILGMVLLVAPASPATLRAAAAYGVVGLVGFLAQMVVAMEARLIPLATWFWSYAASEYTVAPPSPHAMRDRTLQVVVFAAWTAAVPTLAAGMFVESARLVAIGAWSLFAGVALGAVDNAVVVVGHRVQTPGDILTH